MKDSDPDPVFLGHQDSDPDTKKMERSATLHISTTSKHKCGLLDHFSTDCYTADR